MNFRAAVIVSAIRRPISTSTDPLWSYVKLLMHMEGANNGTTFTDQKVSVCSAVGNACTKTSDFRYGTSSGYFDGSGDAVSIVNTGGQFILGSSDTCIEISIKPDATGTGIQQLIGTWWWSYGYQGGWRLAYNTTSKSLSFYLNSGSAQLSTASNVITTGVWNDIAVSRSGTTFGIYIAGVSVASGTISGTDISGVDLKIESKRTDGGTHDDTFKGFIDEARITMGHTRITGPYTPGPFSG